MSGVHEDIAEAIRLIEAGDIKGADAAFTKYYKHYLRHDTRTTDRFLDTIRGDLDALVPYVAGFQTSKGYFNSNSKYKAGIFASPAIEQEWYGYTLRLTVKYAFDELEKLTGEYYNPLEGVARLNRSNRKLAGTKRKLNRRNNLNKTIAAAAPRRSNNNNTGPSGMKLRVHAPLGTLKRNNAAAVLEPPKKKRPGWTGYAELPKSSAAATLNMPQRPINRRTGLPVSTTNLKISGSPSTNISEQRPSIISGLNNNSNPPASAHSNGTVFPQNPELNPGMNVFGQVATRSNLNIGPGSLTFTSENMGFKGGKSRRRTLHKRKRSTRCRKL
jgi:hypothetical protein